MPVIEAFVPELGAVYALPASAVPTSEVSALAHELLNDTVEYAATVVERFPSPTHAFFPSAESSEVISSLRHVSKEFEHDAACRTIPDRDIEEDAGGHYRKMRCLCRATDPPLPLIQIRAPTSST